MKAIKKIAVLILCLALTGCLGTRFLYNQLDWFTVFYVGGLFDLDKEQKRQLRETVNSHFQWHRENQLPKYAAFCRQLDEQMGSAVTPEFLELRYQEMLVIWDELMVHVLPDAAAFLLLLREEQINGFLANVEKDNAKLREEYGGRSAEERLERRERAAIRGVQRITGRLNSDRKEFIRGYVATMHDNSEEWLKVRRQWQTELRDLLQSRPVEPEFSARLSKLILDPNANDSHSYRRKVDNNRHIMFKMFSALAEQLTDKQRGRVRHRLQSYAEDFEYLAEQA